MSTSKPYWDGRKSALDPGAAFGTPEPVKKTRRKGKKPGPRKKTVRRTKLEIWGKKWIEGVAADVETGVSEGDLCRAHGITLQTWRGWFDRGRDEAELGRRTLFAKFYRDLMTATLARKRRLLKKMNDAKDWRAAAKMLEKLDPEWRPREAGRPTENPLYGLPEDTSKLNKLLLGQGDVVEGEFEDAEEEPEPADGQEQGAPEADPGAAGG